MATQKITYDNKVAINVDSTIPDINKCNASDLNQIKSVVNNNADEIPTKTSDLTNDSGFIDKDVNNLTNYTKTSDLSAVATSGSYTDLSNTPTIPDMSETYGTSTTDGYSEAYLNNKLVNVGTSVNSNYRTNILITKNLFDKNNVEVIKGYINSSSGNIIEGGQSNVTKTFIKVEQNTTYTLTCNLVGRIAYYNNEKTFLSQLDTGERNTFTTPANTKYIRFQYQISGGSTIDTIQLELGGQATTYQSFIQKTINVDNNKFTDTINVGTEMDSTNRVNMLYSHNLLNIDVLTIGTFTYDNSGSRFLTNNYIGIEFINAKPSTNYTFSATLPSQYVSIRFVQFDSSKTFISRSNDIYFSNGSASFTTGNNCYYIAILCYKTTTDASTSELVNPMLNEGSIALPYETYLTPSINVDGKEIYSKPTLLWTNSNTTTSYSQTLITLNDNISNYKYVKILYYDDIDNNYLFETYLSGSRAKLIGFILQSNSLYFRQRLIVKDNDNQLTINANLQLQIGGSTSTQNNGCIPYQIIGYK